MKKLENNITTLASFCNYSYFGDTIFFFLSLSLYLSFHTVHREMATSNLAFLQNQHISCLEPSSCWPLLAKSPISLHFSEMMGSYSLPLLATPSVEEKDPNQQTNRKTSSFFIFFFVKIQSQDLIYCTGTLCSTIPK